MAMSPPRSLRPLLVSPNLPSTLAGLWPGVRTWDVGGESPRAPALPLPLLRKGHEEATALGGRSGKAHRAGTQTRSGFRATRAAGPAPSHFLQDRARHGPEAPRGTDSLVPPELQAWSRLLGAGDLHSPPWV